MSETKKQVVIQANLLYEKYAIAAKQNKYADYVALLFQEFAMFCHSNGLPTH